MISPTRFRDGLKDARSLKMRATRLPQSVPWDKACELADATDYPALLASAQEFAAGLPAPPQPLPPIPRSVPASAAAPSHSLFADPRTPAERQEWAAYCAHPPSVATIPLEKAHLLRSSVNKTLPLVPAGTEYVTGLGLDENTTNLLTIIKQGVETQFGTRVIPRTTIAKLLSLHFGPEDNLIYEHFGETTHRDFSKTPAKPEELDVQWAKIPYVPGGKHQWQAVTNLGAFSEVVTGLKKVAAYLPSYVLPVAELDGLYRTLADTSVNYGHLAEVPMLFELFKRRLGAHCSSLVAVATGRTPHAAIPPLTTMPSTLQEELVAHRGYAFNRCMFSISGEEGVFKFPKHDGSAVAPGKKRHREGESPAGDRLPANDDRQRHRGPPRPRVPPQWRGLCAKCHKPGHQYQQCRSSSWLPFPPNAPPAYLDYCGRTRRRAGSPQAAPGGGG